MSESNQVKISYSIGSSRGEVKAEMLGFRPLRVRLLGDNAEIFANVSGQKAVVDIKEEGSDEVLLHATVKDVKEDVLELETLGQNDLREYMRINSILELSYKVIEDEQDMILEDISDFETAALPRLNDEQLRRLAESDEASEAMLFLLQAVQNVDQKLDALIEINRRHMLMPAQSQMQRRRVNISGNGIRFYAHDPVKNGSIVKLVLRLPLKEVYDVQLLAEVLRVDKLSKEQLTEEFKVDLACRFVKIRDYDREKIIAYTLQKQREILRRWRGSF